MTGYGRAMAEMSGRTYTIEIKSLNSKQLDLNMRLPSLVREKEAEIRAMVSQAVGRGKTDLFVSLEHLHAEAISLNRELALDYARVLKTLGDEIGQDAEPDYLALVLRMPDVLKNEMLPIPEQEWTVLLKGMQRALDELDAFRKSEGESMKSDLIRRVEKILALLEKVGPLEQARIDQRKEKLLKSLEELGEKAKINPDRFEQELIYYLERLDFTEEKVRLEQHCRYFTETMDAEDSPGRKLAFISQEMGREINTLGSKANDADIQKLVVEMKDELEKIKEQLNNIL